MIMRSLMIPFVTLAIGCETSSFPNTVPASLEDVDAIRDDSSLTAAEKRSGLVEAVKKVLSRY